MTKVTLISDLARVQLVIPIRIQTCLHEISAKLAVRSRRLGEELEQVSYCTAIHSCVTEVFFPQDLIAAKALIEVIIPTSLY